MTQEYATAPALELLDTAWVSEDEEGITTLITFFDADGVSTMGMYAYETDAFAENGTDAEAMVSLEMPYVAGPDHVIAELLEEYVVFYLSIDEDVLHYNDGEGEEMYLDPYIPAEDSESSEETSAAESEEESEEESATESKEESNEASKSETSTAASSTTEPADDEAGFPIWAIILIAVAAVAVVVVIIIVAKKK